MWFFLFSLGSIHLDVSFFFFWGGGRGESGFSSDVYTHCYFKTDFSLRTSLEHTLCIWGVLCSASSTSVFLPFMLSFLQPVSPGCSVTKRNLYINSFRKKFHFTESFLFLKACQGLMALLLNTFMCILICLLDFVKRMRELQRSSIFPLLLHQYSTESH